MKMGRNKIEKDFKEKLNQREIKPSENVWDRLDAMLAVTEEKKPKRKTGWLYIAAAIISFIAIGTVFLSQTEQVIDSPHNEVVIENEISVHYENTDSVKATIPNTKTESVVTNENSQNKTKNHQSELNQKSNQNQSTPNAVPSVNPINSTENIAVSNQSSINQKAEQKTVTVKVDELLAAVTPSANQKPIQTVKVNAKNLLSQVDGEIRVSFREKVIRTVNKNYLEVAEAVSNRNIQN